MADTLPFEEQARALALENEKLRTLVKLLSDGDLTMHDVLWEGWHDQPLVEARALLLEVLSS